MPYFTQLAEVARRTGFPVTEVSGWQRRGHGPLGSVDGIVCHHTAGRDDLHVIRDGRPGLGGPLSQFWLRRDGRIFVVAAGRCWHNAPSTSSHHTNTCSIGIEAENNGREPWPAQQLEAFRALCAQLCLEFDLPAGRVKGHKEVQRGKPDPHSVNMTSFRADVARLMKEEDGMTPNQVWHEAKVKMNKGTDHEQEVSPAYFLQHLEDEQDRIHEDLAAVNVHLAALGIRLDLILDKLEGE